MAYLFDMQIASAATGKQRGTRGTAKESLLRSLAYTALGTVLGRAIGLFRSMAFVALLPPEELGRWGLAYSVVPIVSWVLALGLPAVLARYGPERAVGRNTLLHWTQKAVFTSTVATFLLALWLRRPLSHLLFGSAAYVGDLLVVVLVSAGLAWLHTAHGAFQGQRRFALDAQLQLLYTVLFAVLSLGGLAVLHRSASVALAAYAMATLSVTAVAWLVLARCTEAPSPKAGSLKPGEVMSFALGLCLAGVVEDVWPLVDRFAILHAWGAPWAAAQAALGAYHAAFTLALPLLLLLSALGVVLVPYAARHQEKHGQESCDAYVAVTLHLAAVAYLATAWAMRVLVPPLASIALGLSAGLWQQLFPLCLAAGGLIGLQHVFKASLVCRGKSWSLVWLWAAMTAFNAVLSVLWVRVAGPLGAAMASVVTGTVGSLAMAWLTPGPERWRHAVALATPALLAAPDAVAGLAVALSGLCVYRLLGESERQVLHLAWRKLRLGGGSEEPSST